MRRAGGPGLAPNLLRRSVGTHRLIEEGGRRRVPRLPDLADLLAGQRRPDPGPSRRLAAAVRPRRAARLRPRRGSAAAVIALPPPPPPCPQAAFLHGLRAGGRTDSPYTAALRALTRKRRLGGRRLALGLKHRYGDSNPGFRTENPRGVVTTRYVRSACPCVGAGKPSRHQEGSSRRVSARYLPLGCKMAAVRTVAAYRRPAARSRR